MAQPSLALIPSTIDNVVYSAIPSDGTGDFSFTRATSATRTNKDGLIETVLSGNNRLDYSQGCPVLLLEPARTNIITYSENFSLSWSRISSQLSVTINDTLSPDGNKSGTKIQQILTSSDAVLRWTGLSIGVEYTFSVWAKKGNYDGFRMDISNIATDFTLTDEWVRYQVTETATGTFVDLSIRGGSVGDYFYIWGAQCEAADYSTSYIPTSSTAVTRNSEVVPFPGVYEFGSLGSGESGTLVIETDVLGLSSANNFNILSQGGSGTWFWNAFTFYARTLSSSYAFNMGVAIGLLVGSTIKIGIRKDNESLSVFYNGSLIDTLDIGTETLTWASHLSSYQSSQGVRKVLEYKTALTNAELIELTS